MNSFTDRDQVSPTVSMNAAGQFVVGWVSDHRAIFDPEDSEKSIFLQWYDATGTATGVEQLAHSIDPAAEAQEFPDVAIDAAGNFVAVWQSITQDGSAWGVYGRQFLADKTPVQASELLINQHTEQNQRRATVAVDPAGNFVVNWQSDLQDQAATAVITRQYNADGTPETDESLVNNWELGPQTLPVTAITPDGDFGVFWIGQGTSRTEGIHGRIYEEGYIPPPPHILVSPLGDQFLVEEAAGLEASSPAVAVIEVTGNYVAAWTSFEQPEGDESGLGVYVQRFFVDGTPNGDAVLVNTAYTDDDQDSPVVAVDAAGNFVVIWESVAQDGDGLGVYGQRYLADGTPLGGAFQVNVVTAGDQENPTVAMDNAGNFVVAWQSFGQDGDGYGVYARRYDSSGTALDASDVLVNTTTEGNQVAPTAARARADSQFVIAWQTEVLTVVEEEVETNVEIYAHLFNAAGGVLLGEFQVNTISEKDQVVPHAAMAPNGSFVVAWTSEGQVGSGADVFARQFNAAGAGLGDDFRANVTTGQGQQNPAVAIDQNGSYIITWESSHQDGFSWGIFARVYDSAGSVVVDEFQVNSNTQGPQIRPDVNANADGTAVVVWLGLDATHHPAVHAQRYTLPQPDEDFIVGPEGEVVLNNYVALEEAPASVAVDEDRNFVAVWQSYGEDGSGLGIFGRRIDSAGNPLADSFLVTTTTDGNQSHPDVAADAMGNFTVVWQSAEQDGDGYGVFGRQFAADQTPLGPEFQINTTTAGHQGVPSIAMNPDDGTFVVMWQGPDADGKGIFGQRFESDATPLGSEFQVNNFTDLDQVSPAVSMNAAGEFVAVWVSDHRAVFDPADTEKTIFAQWYDPDGNHVGDEVVVHTIQPAFEAQESPDVAINPNGDFAVAFQSINQDGNTWGVFARQFLSDKNPVQPIEFQVNQTVLAPQRSPSIVSNAFGDFVIAWQAHNQDTSGPGVFARVYDAAAVAQTDEFLVPTWDQGPQTLPVMAMTPKGDFGVFWTGHGIDRAEGVHGRIYLMETENRFVVNSVGDLGDSLPGDGLCDTGGMIGTDAECTLRAAIEEANALTNHPLGPDTITFDIAGPGLHTISLSSALPLVTEEVVIDGSTEPDYEGTPVIELDGTSAGAGVSGLTIISGGSTVRGLAFNRFGYSGIVLATSGGNTIELNTIGTNPAGTTDLGNGAHGVVIYNSPDNVIGGVSTAQGNVISGNGVHGVYITRSGSTGNTVQSNLIGLGLDGDTPIGNSGAGVRIDRGASTNMISSNAISANGKNGVLIAGASTTGNTVAGNEIGTDITGLLDRGNTGAGVSINNASDNQIGVPGGGNLISGNSTDGVFIAGSSATGNLLQGNLIGVDITGHTALPNDQSGVTVSGGSGNAIGGDGTGEGNTISGNSMSGVYIVGSDVVPVAPVGVLVDGVASGNIVAGNYIGTNTDGIAAVPNGQYGVVVRDAPNNTIGGTSSAARNVISGNALDGVAILRPAATDNVVSANLIGTDVTGTIDLGNSRTGVLVWQAPANTIGGLTEGERNIISGNDLFGVRIATSIATNNTVQGNYIGTDITGTAALPNSDSGVQLANAQFAMIGGSAAGAGNVISGNGNNGIVLTGAGVLGNDIQGNIIGLDATGTTTLGNTNSGVRIANGTHDNTIGGDATAGEGNVISGNGVDGVLLVNVGTNSNTVAGNWIGTDVTGTSLLGNIRHGVFIIDGVSNTIGGTSAGDGNTIAGNGQAGVVIFGAGATENAIRRNSTFLNNALGIDLNLDGVTANDANDPDSGPNNLQNFPELQTAVLNGPNLDITYSVPSITPNSAFPLTVEFFLADGPGQEGQTFLGSQSYNQGTTPTASVPKGAAIAGSKVVATATDASGNTSEFSANVAVSSSLLAASGPILSAAACQAYRSDSLLDAAELEELEAALPSIVNAAIIRWQQTGLDAEQISRLRAIDIRFTELDGAYLGLTTGNTIQLDANAAGYGWFVDSTPLDDGEFSSGSGPLPLDSRPSSLDSQHRIDLLTAVMHEMGHVLGLEDILDDALAKDIMLSGLKPGERRAG